MNRKNMIPLLVLVVLIIIFLLTKLNDKTEKIISFFDVDSSKVAVIEIETNEDTLKLSKIDGKWMIDYPIHDAATQRKLDDLFKKVLPVTTSSIPVSESESSFATYNVTDSLGTIIKLYDAGSRLLKSAIIGTSSGYNNSSARYSGDNKIYRLKENITHSLKPDINSWRNKDVLVMDKENIKNIFVSYENVNYTLSATDTLWNYMDTKETVSIKKENSTLKNIVNGMARVRVTSFIDDDIETYLPKFEEPVFELTVELFDEEKHFLKFIESDEKNKIILQVDDQTDHLYVMFESWIKKFQKPVEDFSK
ncbi:MAG: DUF4340 domain-containing protein [Candidatus Cloacimonetes bacterium]|nr:DUF4340 domain-containing protein [Candidatus Cloacimonadota bacterium]